MQRSSAVGAGDEDGVHDVFNNQTIKGIDQEALEDEVAQDRPVRASTCGEVLGELEPVLYSQGDECLEIITEGEEASEDLEGDAFKGGVVEEDMDEETKLRMQQRTTAQVESDDKIQEMVDSIVGTWENEKLTDEIRKEQKKLAVGILQKTRKMAKLGYSLVTLLRNTGGEITNKSKNDISGK